MPTLLLNASYEPLRVISTKRAVCLILAEKAEVLEAGSGRLRSEHASVPEPAVIRLRHYVQIPFQATIPLNRRSLITRDNHECQVSSCNRAGTTVDHVHPRSKGGRHEWTNVVAMCSPCNQRKADHSLAELGWKLKKEPRAPHGTMWLLVGMGIEPVESWEPYLTPAMA